MAKPEIIKSLAEMQQISANWSDQVGFVPTMGYLHAGHLSLVQAAQQACPIVVVSIYVNPSQFAPEEDLETYPRDLQRDLKLLQDLQVDYLFLPNDAEIYPENYKTWINVEDLTTRLCGKSRPDHFRGVSTIVAKLVNLVNPDLIFMGEKDFQQMTVLQRMLKDLNFRAQIVGCPIVREADGLARSSRNKYILPEDRKQALSLHLALKHAQKLFAAGQCNSQVLIAEIDRIISGSGAKVDYIEIVDAKTLLPLEQVDAQSRIILAAYVKSTRLIDNIKISDKIS
ncbi:MAG: pantoate--beta-alanine ligase [Candidatus Cloacimonadales bacterium]